MPSRARSPRGRRSTALCLLTVVAHAGVITGDKSVLLDGVDGADSLLGVGSAGSPLEQLQVGEEINTMKSIRNAKTMFGIYNKYYGFPRWSMEWMSKRPDEFKRLAAEATVLYRAGDSLDEVKLMAARREPVNIAMNRLYDEKALEKWLGYRHGAYGRSTAEKLMPNIAIYVRTPIRKAGNEVQVHVINLVGYAFDSQQQPDWQYFLPQPMTEANPKWLELVHRFRQMWSYAFFCAKQRGLTQIFLADVGGGAFSSGLNHYGPGYKALKEQSLPSVQALYLDIKVKELPRVPDFFFTAEGQAALKTGLFVNAWDPWSMVGNGNSRDNSLDGYFGRVSAMAVLTWPVTNPAIKYEAAPALY